MGTVQDRLAERLGQEERLLAVEVVGDQAA